MSHNNIRPPPPLPSVTQSTRKNNNNILSKIQISDSDCKWALIYPELHLTCVRFRLCVQQPPYKCIYKHVDSQLQEGTTCGLVAMSMLLDHTIPIPGLLSLARGEKFSNNGELFSAAWAASLLDLAARKVNNTNLRFEVKKMKLFSKEIVEFLLNGYILLVPYDCDKNHTPCLKKGHKAHWAIITGILLTQPIDEMSRENIYVTAKHGKSLHVAVWRLYDLDESNNNLEEFSPDREYDNLEYIVPEGGLTVGLKGQFILIQPF